MITGVGSDDYDHEYDDGKIVILSSGCNLKHRGLPCESSTIDW